MKKSIKNLYLKISLFILLILGFQDGFSQSGIKSGVDKFRILIERKNNEIKLTSIDGCAWKELKFTLQPNKVQAIDKFGMTQRVNGKYKRNSSGMLFTIERRNDELILKGIKGTTWTRLSFTCKDPNCSQKIDQDGMFKE